MGGMQTFATAVESLQKSFKKMNPFCIPFAIQNMGKLPCLVSVFAIFVDVFLAAIHTVI